jgi:5-methylcytosine-specific restriction endonuclease McrA
MFRAIAILFVSISFLFLLFPQVKTQAIIPEYKRTDWNHWIDLDNDCQNLRQELLILESLKPVSFTNSYNCTVEKGLWIDPYSNNYFTLSSDLDIDHVIPLYYAHIAGGYQWSQITKETFANDPENLLIVHDQINRAKGAMGPSDFMPDNNQCDYVKIWFNITSKYKLTLYSRDVDAIEQTLNGCAP